MRHFLVFLSFSLSRGMWGKAKATKIINHTEERKEKQSGGGKEKIEGQKFNFCFFLFRSLPLFPNNFLLPPCPFAKKKERKKKMPQFSFSSSFLFLRSAFSFSSRSFSSSPFLLPNISSRVYLGNCKRGRGVGRRMHLFHRVHKRRK